MVITVSTDYKTNKGTLDNIIDGNRTSYWGAQDGQTVGKSITFSFSNPISFYGLTAVSGSANGTQILSGTSLQVSSDGVNWKNVGSFDGKMTSVISGLNESRVIAIRIYWNSGSNRKLAFYEAEFEYREEHLYRKQDGIWIPIHTILKKEGGRWVEKEDLSEIMNKNIINRGTY